MMTAIQAYALRGKHRLRPILSDHRFHTALHILKHLLRGFVISAASLGQHPQPLALSLVFSCDRWSAVLTALGAAAGYFLFWGQAGLQCLVWLAAGLPTTLLLNTRPTVRKMPMLLPAIAALITAASGLTFQLQFSDATPVLVFLLRICLAAAATHLFLSYEEHQTSQARCLAQGLWVLALAQISPVAWLNFGCVAMGFFCAGGSFWAAALSGLALDLAQITPVPMTAVACAVYFLRLVPGSPKWLRLLLPGTVYLPVMALSGHFDLNPTAAMVIGGLLSRLGDVEAEPLPRRGELGIAQVRLELVAGVFSQMQQLLLQSSAPPIDEASLVARAAQRACTGCPNRKTCREKDAAAVLPPILLHRPLLDGKDLGFACRKEGRLLGELHRSQEQLRTLRASRESQKEHRSALLQQYRFLTEYLQDLSDQLGKRAKSAVSRYKAQISLCANRLSGDSGDLCQSFSGPGCCHFVLLCDGMGTGLGAVQEGIQASNLLKKLLTAGFPAEYALRSINSLCALRGLAGAVTIDLAQLHLDTGKATLYKWGAAPSYLLTEAGAEKIGTATPPPGLSVTDQRETVERLSLRRGETLVLCSDGVGGEDALRCSYTDADEAPGELAARILESGALAGGDDATVAVIRLTADP